MMMTRMLSLASKYHQVGRVIIPLIKVPMVNNLVRLQIEVALDYCTGAMATIPPRDELQVLARSEVTLFIAVVAQTTTSARAGAP